uniref:NADH dehydrogenase subunit 6 n=1 Tax=Tuxedo drakei TaxID=981287 RepID=A0A514LQ12_9HEMI|nr:NADH dehydrogenase subunit 6 [Tuxedo drakei]QDI93917.1 NADH dehydrogenase subunit 6 [Tuxedo drakei]
MIMILMTMNMMFFFLNHPLSMGMILVIQTLTVSIYSGSLMKTFWMAYMLTIMMLSGMLVLFIYMSSIASNEKFETSMKMGVYLLIMSVATILSLFLLKKMIIKNNYLSMGMSTLKMGEMYFLNKMFMKFNLIITILLVVYLLLTMIVSSFLVNIFEGPMRMKI